MDLNRRGFLGICAGALAAPYVVRTSGLLMPVKNRLIPINLSEVGEGVALQGAAYTRSLASIREMLLPGLMEITGTYRQIDDSWASVFKCSDT
jgi:hypothetical protein